MTVGSRDLRLQLAGAASAMLVLAGAALAQQGDTATARRLVPSAFAKKPNLAPASVANAAMQGDTASIRRLVAGGANVNVPQGDADGRGDGLGLCHRQTGCRDATLHQSARYGGRGGGALGRGGEHRGRHGGGSGSRDRDARR